METPGAVSTVLREMAVYGTAMTVAIAVAWGLVVGIVELRLRAGRAPRHAAGSGPASGGA